MPIDYRKYHPNWREISKDIRFNRAKGKCEVCGVNNYAVGFRYPTGLFKPYFISPKSYKQAVKLKNILNKRGGNNIVIVLTVAHLDHNINNNDYSNLKAMCQKCHLQYDKHQHAKSRKVNKAKDQLSIF